MTTEQTARQTVFTVLGFGVVAVILLAAAVVPGLHSARLRAEREANVHLERARRLLLEYDTNLSLDGDHRQLMGGEMFTLAPEVLTELLQNPDYDVTGDVDHELSAYTKLPAVSKLPQAEQELLTRLYGERRWTEHQAPRPQGRMSGPGMVTSGAAEYGRRLDANARLLDDALAEANAALSITRGEYTTRQNAAANRLVGLIHHQQGLAKWRQIMLMRRRLAAQRFALSQHAAQLAAAVQLQGLLSASEIDTRIAQAQADHQAMLARLTEQNKVVSQLAGRSAQLQQQLESAVARGDAARETMRTLEDFGVDLSHPGGFEQFSRAYSEQARRYREAAAEAHTLEHGSLGNATIDHTGDYIKGRYVPMTSDQQIETRRGLKHYEQDLQSDRAGQQRMAEAVAQLEETIQALEHYRDDSLEQRVQAAAARAADLERLIQDDYSGYKDAAESLLQVEDDAIALFDKAIAAFKRSTTAVGAEENEARANQPQDTERQAAHYTSVIHRQDWLKGQITAQQADSDLRAGVVLLGRYQDALARAGDFGTLSVAAGDLPEWVETGESARSAAAARAESAIDLLQRQAKSKIGEGNWIVAAEIGAAHYLLSLLGVEMAAERAIEWYNAALEDREDIAPQHAGMRDHIRSRLQQQKP